MEYILSEKEMEDLVPKKEMEIRDQALDAAKKLILKYAKFECRNFCYGCPIGNLDFQTMSLLCRADKHFPK